MKTKLLVGAALSALVLSGCNENTASKEEASNEVVLETLEQKVSYIFGSNLGGQFARDNIPVDVAALSLAMEDALAKREPRLTQDEMKEVMQTFQQQQQELKQKEAEALATKNKAEGDAFLAENGQKEGVSTTESGLQYKVITEGKGPKPQESDTVTVHYKGTLIDGTEFDSSYGRGQPASFPVTQVIPGWTEALQLMPEGSKWELYIPSDLAYGPGGTGGAIGPNATLVFEVELLKASQQAEAEADTKEDGHDH